MCDLFSSLKTQTLRAIADRLTAKHSAFNSFAELVNAKGSYRPSLCMRDVERIWLADYYDAYMQENDDDRRAYRYAAGTPEGLVAAQELNQILVDAKVIEPPSLLPPSA